MDIAQDIIINEEDCGTFDHIIIRAKDDVAGQSLGSRIFGRLAAANIFDPATGEILCERNGKMDREMVRKITITGVTEVAVRSPLTCELIHGVCEKCYGIAWADPLNSLPLKY